MPPKIFPLRVSLCLTVVAGAAFLLSCGGDQFSTQSLSDSSTESSSEAGDESSTVIICSPCPPDQPEDAGIGSEDTGALDAGPEVTTDVDGGFDAADGSADAGSDGPGCTDACTLGSRQCISGTVQECTPQGNCTQWVTTAMCGPHQACTAGTDGAPLCTCNASICTQAGSVCRDAQTVGTCATDADGCLYVDSASTATCTPPQACSGMAPNAQCSNTCTNSCTQGQTSCVSGGVAQCTLGGNGCWAYGAPIACGTRQTCTGVAGSGQCVCKADPVCQAVGNVCSDSSTAVSCAQDAQGCFYQVSATPCTNGSCSGGVCCTNACTSGTTQCLSNSSTQIQSCGTGSNGCTAWTTSSCATSYVCERYSSPSCVDPQWAEWPIASSGSFTDNGDGTVTDNTTALVWQQATPNQYFTQANAVSYCSALNLGGFTDWRLPSVVELFSIVDYSHGDANTNPAINTTIFPGTISLEQWRSPTGRRR